MPHCDRPRSGVLCRREIVGCRRVNLSERVILHRCTHDQRHIIGSRLVRGIVQTVRVCKMRVLTSKLYRALVHQIRKRTDASRHMLGKTISNLVCRFQEKSVQTLLHGQLIALRNSERSRS